jgi:hypothetical protein
MRDKVENIFIWAVTGFMVGIATLLGYGMIMSSVPPMVYGPVQSIFPSEVRPGETFTMMRDITYTRDTTVTVTRYLTTALPDGRVLHIELSENVGERTIGDSRQKRIITVPVGTPPGVYELHSTVVWTELGFFRGASEAPIIPLVVYQ